jgi:hypothetical protein
MDATITLGCGRGFFSKEEVNLLRDHSETGLHRGFRNSSLAVLNSGEPLADTLELQKRYKRFQIKIKQAAQGNLLVLRNAPESAFVDGSIISGLQEMLFAVLRDTVYSHLVGPSESSEQITNLVFRMLRNAEIFDSNAEANLVVCWGGHRINRNEYQYAKETGHQLGLRNLDICTGCGPGAMKGPMKGAAIGHAKQRRRVGRYIGISEPQIIAAESPNQIVNDLLIMPDIEKRLEAFVRLGHGIIVFPGGAGTAEELLYLLGIMLHPENEDPPFPLILTGPESCRTYFEQIDRFIATTLGPDACRKYKLIIDNPVMVAQEMKLGLQAVQNFREDAQLPQYFNWGLHIQEEFQRAFKPTHQNMKKLEIHQDQPRHLLAANLRKVFSGIVCGNVKESGRIAIDQKGPYEIHGDPEITDRLDELLEVFQNQGRMGPPASKGPKTYRVVKER